MKSSLRNSGLILGLALLLFACEDPGSIGLDVESSNLQFKVAYKKFVLPATLVQTDSIPTSSSSRILTGSYNDPNFGYTKATGYGQVVLRSRPSITDDATYDSLFLQLKYDYVHGTETKAENKLEIRRLEDLMDGFATYYSKSTLKYSDSPIGEITFKYNLNDREEVIMDTVLRIPLSNDLGNEFFSKAKDETDSTFDSYDNWLFYFNGIALVSDDSYQTITGFNTDDDNSKMTLYYHFTNTDGEVINRTIDFQMADGLQTNSFEYDRSNTPIREITEYYKEYGAIDNFIYVQSGTGLVAKVDFTDFIHFSDTIQTLIINRADLTLGKVETYPTYTSPPQSLVYYLTDSTNRRILVEEASAYKSIQQDNPLVDPSGTRFPLQSDFIEDDQLYSDPLSGYLQALYEGTVTERYMLTYPSFTSNSKTFDRFILDPQKIILEVYYSTPDQPVTNN